MTRTAGVSAAVVGGIGVAMQSKVNGQLGHDLHDGYLAALISFGGGLVVIGVIAACQPTARQGLRSLREGVSTGEIRPWQCLGGVLGALLVVSQGLTVSTLGVALFTVAIVAGQSLSSLAVDRIGLGPAGPQALTLRRVVGAVLTVVAVVIAVADHFGTPGTLALAILPLVSGMGSAVQQAINGHVRAVSTSVTAATLVNFVAGTAACALAVAVDFVLRGLPSGSFPWQPWLYLGGAFGVVFIAIAAAVVRDIGVLLLGLAMIAGQLIGSLGLDIVLPPSSGRPPLTTYAGVVLTLVAVVIAGVSGRRKSAPETLAHPG